jgi:antitoxin component YwqK of YwqJK toxin-antitoxin module
MGKKEGEWFYYDTDGIVIVKITYKNGIEKKYDRVVIQPVIEE